MSSRLPAPARAAWLFGAARSELTVELVEPSRRIGGLVTSGLSHSDFRTFEALTGAFLGCAQRVEKHYARTYGPDSPQVRESFRGTLGEPKVNLLVLEEMLAAQWWGTPGGFHGLAPRSGWANHAPRLPGRRFQAPMTARFA
jgi:hypothetical protein